MDQESHPHILPIEEIKSRATSIAGELRTAKEITRDLRQRFIEVRSALFQRGIFDPVLVRFDSATAPRASKEEIADQLATVAESL